MHDGYRAIQPEREAIKEVEKRDVLKRKGNISA